jgi:predicted amidohydrolase YtcJ
MSLIVDVLPAPTVEQGRDAILAAGRHMASLGITSATDLNTGDAPDITPQLAMYRLAAESGDLRVRLGICPNIRHVAPQDSDAIQTPEAFDPGVDSNWLAVRSTKIFSDGALSTRTAAVRDGYFESPGNDGILIWAPETLASMIDRAHRAGWQIATHALGDRAVATVLRCYAMALRHTPRKNHRHRIEHLMLLNADLVAEIDRLGIVPNMQPDIFRLGDGYVTALGPERAQEVIPMRLFRGTGITVAFSSDAPVIPSDPLAVIRSAMERRTPSGEVLGLHHSVTAMEGVQRYTAGGAYATHADADLGTLEPGKWADFAVLSRDPASTPADEFGSIRVVRTVVGGENTYTA